MARHLCIGFEQLTSLSSSTGLTAAVYKNADFALIESDLTANKNIRWRPDGSTNAPTSTVGHVIQPGAQLEYDGDLAAIRFIEESASAKMNVSYYLIAR